VGHVLVRDGQQGEDVCGQGVGERDGIFQGAHRALEAGDGWGDRVIQPGEHGPCPVSSNAGK
jgi:hypothetical protein